MNLIDTVLTKKGTLKLYHDITGKCYRFTGGQFGEHRIVDNPMDTDMIRVRGHWQGYIYANMRAE